MLTCASDSHQYVRWLGIIELMNFLITLLKLCVRKAQPDELPYNQTAAILLVFIYAAVSWFSLVKLNAFSDPIIYALFIAGTQILGVFILLRIFSKLNRFNQTLTALLGTSILISIASSVIAAIAPIPFVAGFLLFWQLYIPTTIIKSALEIPAVIAFFSYIGIVFFSLIFTAVVFPDFMPELEALLQSINEQTQQVQS